MSTSDRGGLLARAATLALALHCICARPATDLEGLARNLAFELSRTEDGRWRAPASGEVAVGATPRADALAARLAGQLQGRGLSVRRLSPTVDADTSVPLARDAGAEWLVYLRPLDNGRWQATLLDLDPGGLWGPNPARPVSLALVTAEGPASGPVHVEPPPPLPPTPSPALRPGPLVKLGELEGRVLDLATCGAVPQDEALFALTADALVRLEGGAGGLSITWRGDLTGLPPAATPTRAPVGQIACRDDDFAFGHGGLAHGEWRSLRSLGARGRPLPGLPHGFEAGRALVSPLARGTNQHRGAPTWVTRTGQETPAEGEWPDALRRDLDTGRPEGWRVLAQDMDGDWRRGAGALPVSGAGARARHVNAHLVLVSTSREAARDADSVQIFIGESARPLGPPWPVEGEVYATAIWRRNATLVAVIFAAWRPEANRTDLLSLNLEATP